MLNAISRCRRINVLAALAMGLVAMRGEGAGANPVEEKPWAFKTVVRPEPPPVEPDDKALVRNPIDAFVVRGIRLEGLTPAPEADRRTLIRRLTFDLNGLPPTPEEIEAFLSDARPDAYERLVDRLLDSPRYGERWGRHWLDLVRYAETHGYERDDPKPNAWQYRDWVVRALNADLPYDQFILEQIAGDEMPGASDQSRIATGMYRLGLIDDEPADPVMDRFDQLDDMVRTIGTAFLGLTIHCARCHDHKFDPIPTRDYYRLLAFFEPAERYRRDDVASISIDLASESERARIDELNAAVDRQIRPLRERLKAAEGHEKEAIESRIRRLESDRPTPPPMVLGLTDASAEAGPTHVLIRGDARTAGQAVEPGFLSILDPGTPVIRKPEGAETSGRRLVLARWIASAANPLTTRVVVNRLWQLHFGRGMVGTPGDFGAMGEEPVDPELLDWLAAELVDRGWSIKAMHRLIVTSAAYRRSGEWNEHSWERDPFNLRTWRQPPRRLEAEAIRDAVLSVAGTLNPTMGGPSVRPPIPREILATQSRPGNGWKVSEGEDAFRRSLYVFAKRTLPLPELELLDAPSPDEPCPQRVVTTTAPQALMLLNGAFWHEQAEAFARRIEREAGPDPADRVDRAFRLALARPPSPTERDDSLFFLSTQATLIGRRPNPEDRTEPGREALRALCLVLLNCNEFVTVD